MITPNEEYTLGTRAFVLFALEEMRGALVVIALAILFSIFRDATGAPFLIGATRLLDMLAWLGVILGLAWSYWKFRNIRFSLQEFDFKMKSGILEKKEVSIPYRQIQSVDIVRSLTHQMLGLSKLVMLTAGHEENDEHKLAEVVLEPVDKGFAEEIRNALQERVGVQIVRPETSQ